MDNFLIGLAVALMGALVVIVVAVFLALPTMLLWNWLMPDIFNLCTIGFWQALGLNMLSGFLIKGSSHPAPDTE